MNIAYGPGSSVEELNRAFAIAVDMGAIEDKGKEQSGDFHGILQILYVINHRLGDCLRFRVLRTVVDEGSRWGLKGQVLDTTDYDKQFVAFRSFPSTQNMDNNFWYFEEGVSAAVLVVENAYTDVTGNETVVLSARNHYFPVLPKIAEQLDSLTYLMLFPGVFLLQPSMVLDEIGMKPEDIIRCMEEKRVRSHFGEAVPSREDSSVYVPDEF